MSQSPTNYGFEGDPLLEAYMNAKFSEEISEMMKVPKRISANGVLNEEILNGHDISSWNYHESPDMMTVPDRIVVLGQDQHLVLSGTKSAPREIVLENSILPKDAGFVRVSTPPRVITLNDHYFPGASERAEHEDEEERRAYPKTLNFADDTKKGLKNNRRGLHNSQEFVINPREETPQFSGMGSVENLSQSHDEVLHLRKQVAKLNRRLLNVEIDNLQRTQREKILCIMGVAYFVLKALFWLNRK